MTLVAFITVFGFYYEECREEKKYAYFETRMDCAHQCLSSPYQSLLTISFLQNTNKILQEKLELVVQSKSNKSNIDIIKIV